MDARDGAEGIATSKAKLSYADFLLFPDDGQRHELIDGEHYVTPSPNIRHQRLVTRLSTELANYLRLRPIGEAFVAPLDCVMSDFDIVEPDLLVVLADQSNILTPQNVRGAPALVVEILSPGTRRVDERIKRDLYERAGVREYWIIDPLSNEIRVHARETTGQLRKIAVLKADSDQVLRTDLLPEFQLPLAEYFR